MICECCGQIDYALLNGYAFGDRLLEDVYFQVRVDDNKKYSVVIDPMSAKYFSQLNEKMWLDAALKYMNRADFLVCPKCNEDVEV